MNFEEFKKEYQKVPIECYPNNVPNDPMVSICVQTYQHADYIEDCLEGILMQETDFTYEILLGEDASTDGTREICIEYAEKYPDKIRLILHERENNIEIGSQPSGRFNFLYNLYSARGKYIAICEGDDYWTDPQKLQKQVGYLDENPNVGIIHTNFRIKNEIRNSTKIHKKNIFDPSLSEFKNYLFTGDMRTLTVVFRSKFIGEIDKLFETKIMEKSPIGDRPTFLTIASKSEIGYIDEVTGVYRRYEGESATRFKSMQKKFELSRKGNELNLSLMSYLNINDDDYRRMCKRKLRKANFFLLLFEIPLFRKLYAFLYNTIGLGGHKNSGYY